jgi:ABC-type antimicrobial peptide transport system permease subunit
VEFLRLDPGEVFRKNPAAKAFKMVRIIAGNPLIMKIMAERVSDAATAILNPVLLLRRTALVLSLVGLASTVSFAIAQRTNEIGIRMALGAQRANVVWIVIRVMLATVASGIAGGLVLNLTLGRVLRHWMPGSVIAPWMLLE